MQMTKRGIWVTLIANIIDFLAAMLQVASGSIKNKAKILVVQTVQLLMQGVSMLLVGGITGAVNNALSCLRNYLCYKDKLNGLWKAVIIVASVALTVCFNDQGLLLQALLFWHSNWDSPCC